MHEYLDREEEYLAMSEFQDEEGSPEGMPRTTKCVLFLLTYSMAGRSLAGLVGWSLAHSVGWLITYS